MSSWPSGGVIVFWEWFLRFLFYGVVSLAASFSPDCFLCFMGVEPPQAQTHQRSRLSSRITQRSKAPPCGPRFQGACKQPHLLGQLSFSRPHLFRCHFSPAGIRDLLVHLHNPPFRTFFPGSRRGVGVSGACTLVASYAVEVLLLAPQRFWCAWRHEDWSLLFVSLVYCFLCRPFPQTSRGYPERWFLCSHHFIRLRKNLLQLAVWASCAFGSSFLRRSVSGTLAGDDDVSVCLARGVGLLFCLFDLHIGMFALCLNKITATLVLLWFCSPSCVFPSPLPSCTPFPFAFPFIAILVAFLGLLRFWISCPGRPGRHIVALLVDALLASPFCLICLSLCEPPLLPCSFFPGVTAVGLFMALVLWQAGLAGIRTGEACPAMPWISSDRRSNHTPALVPRPRPHGPS